MAWGEAEAEWGGLQPPQLSTQQGCGTWTGGLTTGCCRDWDAEKEAWGWTRPPPVSTRSNTDPSASPKKLRRKVRCPGSSVRQARWRSQGKTARMLLGPWPPRPWPGIGQRCGAPARPVPEHAKGAHAYALRVE